MKILILISTLLVSCVTTTMYDDQSSNVVQKDEENMESNQEVESNSTKTEELQKPQVQRPRAVKTVQKGQKPAVRSLLTKAKKDLESGNLEMAQSYVERAYRIDHRDPEVSYIMGKILFSKDHFQQAEQWGMNSVELYKKADRSKIRHAWELVSQCRLKLGDFDGANLAIRNANNI